MLIFVFDESLEACDDEISRNSSLVVAQYRSPTSDALHDYYAQAIVYISFYFMNKPWILALIRWTDSDIADPKLTKPPARTPYFESRANFRADPTRDQAPSVSRKSSQVDQPFRTDENLEIASRDHEIINVSTLCLRVGVLKIPDTYGHGHENNKEKMFVVDKNISDTCDADSDIDQSYGDGGGD